MTVIAYSRKHKVMAADSRCSDEYLMHLTNCRKIFRLKNGALVGTAGDDDDRLIRDVLSKATPRRMPTRQQLADTKTCFHGIMVFPKGQVFVVGVEMAQYANSDEWTGWISPVTDDVVAVGHGQQFAYGALDLGHNPVEAVRVTCKRDTTCALPVQWESLDGTSKDVPSELGTKEAPDERQSRVPAKRR